MNQVVIAGQSVAKIEYKGQPVVTFRMIDELHQRPESTARQTFNRNKERFIKDEDYFEVPFEEWSKYPCFSNSKHGGQRNKIVFLTQSGYLLVINSFRCNTEISKEICHKYFGDESINFLLVDSAESEFGKILTDTFEGLVTVRSQVKIQDYRVDFLLSEYGIIVEYDENHHQQFENRQNDMIRERSLSSLGYIVIRVKKDEPTGQSLNKVLTAIMNQKQR